LPEIESLLKTFTYRNFMSRAGLLVILGVMWHAAGAQFAGSQRVEDLLSAAAYDVGQAELILIKDGKVVYKRVFSDVQSATEKKVRVGASAKWLVAATLLSLVDQKLITLDEPIGKYPPQFKSAKATIT
jgi:CubicO group peptidase (beta-lactamase class C family)